MAADDNEIRISITLDDGTVREGFARIKKEGEDAGHGLKDAFADVKKELAALLVAYLGFEAVKHFIESSTEAAMAYETALNNMNKALNLAGSYTAEASAQFQGLAKHMAETTTMTQTQVLSLESMALNYARTTDQAKALTKAAIDLGAATGKGADAALQQLGGTLNGTSGRLSKMVPELKSMTEMQLRAGDAIAVVAARFKDAAAGDLNTFEGTTKKLKNSFEELQIAIGSIITQNPAFRAVLKYVTSAFESLGQWFKDHQETFKNWFTAIIGYAIDLTRVLALLGYPLELFYNVAKIAINGVMTLIYGFITVLANVAGVIVSTFAPDSAAAKAVRGFTDGSTELMKKFAGDTGSALKNTFDFSMANVLEDRLTELKAVADNAAPLEGLRTHINQTKSDLYGLSGPLESVAQSFKLFGQGASDAMLKMRNDSVKAAREAGDAFSKGFAPAVANGMAAVGKALVKGQDIFQAFAGAMLSAIGQACIQMGAAYLMMGIARVATSYGADPTGWELIGVGSGMSILGGALMALGDGMTSSGGSGAPAASASGASGGGGAPVSGNPASQTATPQTTVQVNIHGSVFDTKETGLRIVELVNDAFNTQGAKVQVV